MYCPNCGNQNSTEQKFCRKCGMNLEASAASLVQQTAGGDIEPSDRHLELFGNVVFGGLGIIGLIVVGGLIFTLFSRFVLTGESIAFGLIMSLLLLFGVLAIAFVVLNEGRKEKLAKKGVSIEPPSLEAASTGKLLEERHFEPVPSAIEDTTDLLKVEARTKKL